jgi:hypothetical protein
MSYCWWLNFQNGTTYDVTATAYFSAGNSPKTQYIGTAGVTASLYIDGCVTQIVFDGIETKGTEKKRKQSFTFVPTQRSAAGNMCANYHVTVQKDATGALYATSTQP